jgi:hypothetical protein
MASKTELTSKLLSEAGFPTDDSTVKKYLRMIWKDARPRNQFLQLTDFGFKFLNEQAKLKFYPVLFSKKTVYTNDLIISLNKFIDCPFYISRNEIFVSREKVAIQFILYESSLERFVRIKKHSLIT